MRVLLIIDTLPADLDIAPADPLAQSIAAIEKAIVQFPISPQLPLSTQPQLSIVEAHKPICPQPDDLLCPLTLNLPASLHWQGQAVYPVCREVEALRDRVRQIFGVPITAGDFWLPIVLTAKGALYAEVICRDGSGYHQPLHLPDLHRQPLYRLAYRLLKELSAPPSVYLLQFGWTAGQIGFDRLYPFPAEPSIASLNVQTSDLFACHWQCLTQQPILDVQIPGNAVWRSAPSITL